MPQSMSSPSVSSTFSLSSEASSSSTSAQSPKQDALISFCRTNGWRTPTWQVISDRRGGRTAWSCTVNVQGHHIAARFWYDGQYVNSAREDAAEKALQFLGQMPTPAGPQPTHYHHQQRTAYGTGTNGDVMSSKFRRDQPL